MKKLYKRFLGVFITLLAPLCISTAANAAADTCIWTGGAADDNFSSSQNWSTCDNGNLPESGDILEFPANITDGSPVNDLTAGTSFLAINFTGTTSSTSSYTLSGNAIVLMGGITNSMINGMSDSTSTAQTIDFDITLGADQVFDHDSLVSYNGNIDLGSYTITFSGNSLYASTARVFGDVSGTGGIIKIEAGSLRLYGSNTFSGPVSINAGSISAQGTNGLGTSAGGTTVEVGASLSLCAGNDADQTVAEPLTLKGESMGIYSAMLNVYNSCSSGGGAPDGPEADPVTTLSGAIILSDDVDMYGTYRDLKITGPLSGTGKIIIPKGNDFKVSVESSSNTSGNPNGVVNSAVDETTYSGDQSATSPYLAYNNNAIVAEGGTLGDVTLEGGLLKGKGTVGTITMSLGVVAPGLSPGCLTSGNLSYTGGAVEIEIDGTTACTQYDRQVVNGTVDLGTSTALTIKRLTSYVPALNTAYTIINNDGSDAVTGTFTGLAQGATTVVDGVTYTISYTGGDGNDVVLTVTNVASTVGTPNTGFSLMKSNVLLPLFAIASGITLILMRKYSLNK